MSLKDKLLEAKEQAMQKAEKKQQEEKKRIESEKKLKLSLVILGGLVGLLVLSIGLLANSGDTGKTDVAQNIVNEQSAESDAELAENENIEDVNVAEAAKEAVEETVKEAEEETTDISETEKIVVEEGTVQTEDSENSDEDILPVIEGNVEVHYIDVGQGDATLIKCNEHSLLIDAGNNTKGTTVQLYLKKQGVDKNLDAVIWTHPDADHIGGADVIVTKYDIGTIYQTSLTSDTKAYSELMDAIDYRGYKTVEPSPGDSFELGGALVTFLGPRSKYDDDNNNSIVCLVQFGDTGFLFTGDAEQPAESAILNAEENLTADVYKAGHHGSNTASSEEFLNKINPIYAVISCSKDNTYGHPHLEVMDRLKNKNIQMFRTDVQGSIVATSNGKEIIWNTVPSDNWETGTAPEDSAIKDTTKKEETVVETSAVQTPQVPAGSAYVLNTNSYKFHYPGCKSVNKMAAHNRQDYTGTREDIIAMGYSPCGNCNP